MTSHLIITIEINLKKNRGGYMMRLFLTSLAVLMFTFSSPAQNSWETDLAHSNINFTIAHLVIADVTGKFNDFSCTVHSNGDDFNGAEVEVSIKTSSIFTNNERRDNHLRSADFFDVEKFPLISFKSRSFEKTSENTYKISGMLNMHGISKPVVLDARYKGMIKDPWGNTRAGFKATTSLNRYDYDLKWNTALEAGGLLVGETVAIEINLELLKK
jgi:polyisoprenoid-binding protein YceI